MIINMNGAKAPETPSPILQEKTVTPETLPVVIGADEGYDGLSQVTVNPDSQLVAENIREGKTIFGVEGAFTPVCDQIVRLENVSAEGNLGDNSRPAVTADEYGVPGIKEVYINSISGWNMRTNGWGLTYGWIPSGYTLPGADRLDMENNSFETMKTYTNRLAGLCDQSVDSQSCKLRPITASLTNGVERSSKTWTSSNDVACYIYRMPEFESKFYFVTNSPSFAGKDSQGNYVRGCSFVAVSNCWEHIYDPPSLVGSGVARTFDIYDTDDSGKYIRFEIPINMPDTTLLSPLEWCDSQDTLVDQYGNPTMPGDIVYDCWLEFRVGTDWYTMSVYSENYPSPDKLRSGDTPVKRMEAGTLYLSMILTKNSRIAEDLVVSMLGSAPEEYRVRCIIPYMMVSDILIIRGD